MSLNNHHPDYKTNQTRLSRIKLQRRIAGQERLDELWSDAAPRPKEIAPADVDALRRLIRDQCGMPESQGLVKAIEPHEYEPGYVSRGINMTPELEKLLFRLAGWPLVDADSHGECKNCRWADNGKDRGWSAPCNGCGVYNPLFEAKEKGVS